MKHGQNIKEHWLTPAKMMDKKCDMVLKIFFFFQVDITT